MREIDCVIFDAGNVLYTLDFHAVWNGLSNRSGKGLAEVQTALYLEDAFIPFEMGKISAVSFYRSLTERLCCSMSFEEFKSIWNSMVVKREDMFELARALKKTVRIAVLSNTNEINAAFMEEDLAALTSDVIYSCRVGLIKPDPEIYRLAIGKVGLPPERILLVDDLLENVEGARQVGLTAYHFRNREDLIATLGEYGLVVPALSTDKEYSCQ